MAEWSTALPLTDHCLLSLITVWVQILAGVCEKVARDLELGSGFHQVLWFPTPLTTGQSQICLNMAENVMQGSTLMLALFPQESKMCTLKAVGQVQTVSCLPYWAGMLYIFDGQVKVGVGKVKVESHLPYWANRCKS